MHENPIRDIPHYLRVFQDYLGMRLYLIFALTLVAALAEGIGILMLLPLLEELDVANTSYESTTSAKQRAGQVPLESHDSSIEGINSYLYELLDTIGWGGSIYTVLLFITVAFIAKGILTFGSLGFIAYLRGQLLRELKARMFEYYTHMNYGYYASHDTGHFINIINEQINRALQSFKAITQLGAQFVSTIVYVCLALMVAWRFGLMALCVGLVLLVMFRWLNNYVRQLSRKTAIEYGYLSKLLIQTLHAFKYLTSTGQFAPLRKTINGSINCLTNYQIRSDIAGAFTSSVREPVAVIFIMLIVLVQISFLQQPVTPILVSILLFYRGLNSILAMQGNWQNTLEFIGSLEFVRDEFTAQTRNQEVSGVQQAKPLSHAIKFNDIHFSYDNKLGDVLKGVTLEIPVRTSVAFVGDSGAGKSTLVDLMTLMLKPHTGKILIDGIPSSQISLESWRKQIGYVSQEIVVFDDTIANNICLWEGDTRENAKLMERVQLAANQANISSFIESLPEGYQTLVGDRGLRLSGGQRQRLFIARELFRKPNILILDEATSALDSESERAIQQSIDALKGQITVVIIAHRLSTIRNVDQVYVFDQGKLVEQGGYVALRDADNSRFGKLVAMQAL